MNKISAYDVCRYFFAEKDRKDTGKECLSFLIFFISERSDPEQNPRTKARVDIMYFLFEHSIKLLADFISQIGISKS